MESVATKVTGTSEKVAESNNLQHYGKLGDLPLELREPIYKNVLSSGHVALMRCSRILYAEMANLIYEHGIYRLPL